jgi:hypothetical protein
MKGTAWKQDVTGMQHTDASRARKNKNRKEPTKSWNRTKLFLLSVLPLITAVSAAAASPDITIYMSSSTSRDIMCETGKVVRLVVSDAEASRLAPNFPPNGAPRIQWIKNGIPLDSGTNQLDLYISNVSFADVGSYSVFINGASTRAESEPVHLNVYSLCYSNSNGGAAGLALGSFSIGANSVCGDTGFDSWKVNFPFYGPNASPQSGPFTNSSASSNLDLTTCTNLNGAVDTAIKVQENWLGTRQVGCNNDDGNCTNCSLHSSCTVTNLSALSGSVSNSYRVTVYFKRSTLDTTNTTIYLRWYYHN